MPFKVSRRSFQNIKEANCLLSSGTQSPLTILPLGLGLLSPAAVATVVVGGRRRTGRGPGHDGRVVVHRVGRQDDARFGADLDDGGRGRGGGVVVLPALDFGWGGHLDGRVVGWIRGTFTCTSNSLVHITLLGWTREEGWVGGGGSEIKRCDGGEVR